MRAACYIALILMVGASAGCDTVEPVESSQLVIEGFLDAGEPLPNIFVRRTLPPAGPYSESEAAVSDASVRVIVDGATISYAPHPSRPGTYVPSSADLTITAGQSYSLRVRWDEIEVEADGIVPPEIHVQDVQLHVPDEPVSAVFLDSLALSDSLSTGAYTGYIYPVEVTVLWDEIEAPPGESWVRLQLKPYASFSSPVVDLFLKSDEILSEEEQPLGAAKARVWTGVYAVGVPDAHAPMPEHQLRVSMIRSGEDYARFAASRNSPNRREPISNLTGAAGIFTAISVDSLHVRVAQDAQ